MKSPKYELLLRGYRGIVTGIIFVGLVLIIWGATNQNSDWSLILSSVGGAIFGASLSLLLADISGKDAVNETKNILSSYLNNDLSSLEESIKIYRTKWHHYHVTKMNDRYIWRHRIYDFSCYDIPGQLKAEIVAKDKRGYDHSYIVKAGVRDQRFFFFEKAAVGSEPTIIEVYPSMGLELQGVHCGLGFMRTWDGNDVAFPCMMSRNPVIEFFEENDIPEQFFDDLDLLWKGEFTNLNALIPRILDNF